MTSEAKILANRRNAKRSTGPRAAPAKARVRGNALQHGLAAVVVVDPTVAAEVDRVAATILAGAANQLELGLSMAEAQVTLSRVRSIRAQMIEQMSLMPPADTRDNASGAGVDRVSRSLKQLLRLERYERRALAQRKRAVQGRACGDPSS